MTDADCVALLQWALPRLRMRWPGFRKVRRQVCRRIRRRLEELGLADGVEYRALLETHEDEWMILDGCCRVTISRFFRDREVFQALQTVVLPQLLEEARKAGRKELLCWSAGCGSGEEAYTLSLLWRLAFPDGPELSLLDRYPDLAMMVTATDTDLRVLERARQAVYPRGALKDLPTAWIGCAFDPEGGELSLRSRFREGVAFLLQDIRDSMPEGSFDLILCRNLVFTYFDEELQREVLTELLGCLREPGFLVIGGHEVLPQSHGALSQLKSGLPVFRKHETGRHVSVS